MRIAREGPHILEAEQCKSALYFLSNKAGMWDWKVWGCE